MFPNPVIDEINVFYSKIPKESEIKIYDLNGKEVLFKKEIGVDDLLLNVSNFVDGIYFLEIKIDEKLPEVKKIIIAR